ncbi:MFS transporter [Nocardiopsis xinjiangensis]|uniref:MFS transporter n=1 Tax=Nocardiopsis xinjiangensis TaxID=124285 RepID=UPI0003496E48|nr:MFS transporter [Nocardiopsis xinjiangensis]
MTFSVFLNRVGGFFAIFLTLVLADRGYDANEITFGLAVVAVCGAAGAGVSGILADRFGAKGTVAAATALSAVLSLSLVNVQEYVTTLVLAGAMNASLQAYTPVAQAIVGEASPPECRVPNFALYRVALNIGVAGGSLLGGLWAAEHMSTLLIGNAVVSALSSLLLFSMLPKSTGSSVPPAAARSTHGRRSQGPGLLANPYFVVVCVLFGVTSLVYAQHTGPFPLAITDAGFSTSVFGALLSLNAVFVIVFEVPIAMGVQRLPVRVPIVAGAVCVFGGFLINALGLGWAVLIIGVLFWTLGEILISPVAAATASNAAPAGAGARYQAFLGFCQMTGMSAGPALGVFLYGLGPQVPWLVSGVLGCLVAALFFWLLPLAVDRGTALSHPESDPMPQNGEHK